MGKRKDTLQDAAKAIVDGMLSPSQSKDKSTVGIKVRVLARWGTTPEEMCDNSNQGTEEGAVVEALVGTKRLTYAAYRTKGQGLWIIRDLNQNAQYAGVEFEDEFHDLQAAIRRIL